jgi:hypothetical protein
MTPQRIVLGFALGCAIALLGAPAAAAASCTAGTPRWGCVWHTAKAARYPGNLPCAKTTGATVCFQRKGEKVWVKDTRRDSLSAISKAKFPLFRTEFYCRNKLGSGRWGVCNENLLNGSPFYFWAARYDGSTGGFLGPWSAGKVATA